MRNKILLPELEQKKQKLESIRSFYQPIRREEISEHARKFDRDLREKIRQRKESRDQQLSEIRPDSSQKEKLNTKFMMKIIEEEKHKAKKLIIQKKEIVDKKNKMDNYSKIVKEMHRPEVSPKKQKEMEDIKREINKYNKPLKVVNEKMQSNKFERGNEYMSSRYSKHLLLKESKYPASEAEDANEDGQLETKKTHVNWK